MVRFFAFGLVALSAGAPAYAVVGEYSYDITAPLGPPNWASVEIEDNQCGGLSQSPIAITSMECSEYSDYKFEVRPLSPFPFMCDWSC
jgi:carbonic anhydrase